MRYQFTFPIHIKAGDNRRHQIAAVDGAAEVHIDARGNWGIDDIFVETIDSRNSPECRVSGKDDKAIRDWLMTAQRASIAAHVMAQDIPDDSDYRRDMLVDGFDEAAA